MPPERTGRKFGEPFDVPEQMFEHGEMSSTVADLLARLPGGAVAPASVALGRLLPVLPPLRPLLPGGGLRRGTTVEVAAELPGASSLLLALLAGASQAGSWCAVVGAPGLGAAAAHEAGVDLERLVLVPAPGPGWARAAAALLDGFDLVAVHPSAPAASTAAPTADQRALAGRARHHGAVLLSLGAWPGADLRLSVTASVWEGLGDGHGHLRARRVAVTAGGRGSAGGRPRSVELWLPSADAPLAPVAGAGLRGEEAV
jgi:hypothetical protein